MAITLVQSAVNTAAMNFGSGSVTLSASANPGNTVIIIYDGPNNPVTVADNNGVIVPEAALSPVPLTTTPNGGYLHCFSYTVPASGSTTAFNFTQTGSFAEAIVMEFSGMPAGSTLQATSPDEYNNQSILQPVATVTPTSTPTLALGIYLQYSGSMTAGSGWTLAGTVSTNSVQLLVEYQIRTNTSSVTPLINATGSTGPDVFAQIWGAAGAPATPLASALLFL